MKRIQIAKYSYIATSVFIILIGCFFVIRPETPPVTFCRAVGVVILVSGLAKLFGYFANDTRQLAFQFDLAFGAFTIFLCIAILIFPERFSEHLAVLVSVFVILNASFTIQNAIEAKSFGIKRWWLLLTGAIAAFLVSGAVFIMPEAKTLLTMHFVGIALILDGLQNIIVAFITIYRRKTN